jgi:Tol biopolymer transport system component
MLRSMLTFGLLLTSLLSLAGCGSPERGSGDDDDGGGSKLSTLKFTGDLAGDEARFSPDGEKLAFIQIAIMGDAYDLGVMSPSGQDRTILAPAGSYLAAPAWSPDGTKIYFTSDNGISVVAADGGTALMAVDAFAAMDPDISPDGMAIVYGINGGSLKLASLVDPEAAQTDLMEFGTSPRFSPDGKSIAFESGDKIKIMTLGAGMATEVLDAGTYLASVDWFPDGKRIAITSDKGVEIVTLGESPDRKLVRDEFAAKNVDVSPDGESLTYGINGSNDIYVIKGL